MGVAPYIVFLLVWDGWFAKDIGTTKALAAAHPDFEAMIEQVTMLQKVDFSPLRKPWLDYKEHTSVDCERARMMTACTVHYSLDTGLVVCYLGGEYTGAWRKPEEILPTAVTSMSSKMVGHMQRILGQGAPANFN